MARQLYHLSPDHHAVVEENRELVEFSLQHNHQPTLQAVAGNPRGQFFHYGCESDGGRSCTIPSGLVGIFSPMTPLTVQFV